METITEKMRKILPVYQKTESYNFAYPQYAIDVDYAIKNNHWTWEEIDVKKDIQDFLVELTASEKHAVTTILKLFTKYEVLIGEEYWGGRFKKIFKRPEFRRIAAFYAHQELNIHAPFYNELNKILSLNTDEFYNSYLEDPILTDRVNFISKMLNDENDFISLAAFSFLEGAVLYSSFSFMKHFQTCGKNLMNNVIRGIDFSILEEALHAKTGSNAFKLIKKEAFEYNILTPEEFKKLVSQKIYELVVIIAEHEEAIIYKLFEKGSISNITKSQIRNFVYLRLNFCLNELDMESYFEVNDYTIQKWFDRSALQLQSNDTFAGQGREYSKGYSEDLLYYNPEITTGY